MAERPSWLGSGQPAEAGSRAGLWALAFVVVGALAVAAVFLLSASRDGGDPAGSADVVLVGAARDGQAAFDGVQVLRDDDGELTQPPRLRGRGLADRWVAIESRADVPVTLRLDPGAASDAEAVGTSARIGFVPGRSTASYPRRVVPQLSDTIAPGARGLLVLRVRIRSCSEPSEEPVAIGGPIDVTRGPGAPRRLLVATREQDGGVLPEPSERTSLAERLQVAVPRCPGG